MMLSDYNATLPPYPDDFQPYDWMEACPRRAMMIRAAAPYDARLRDLIERHPEILKTTEDDVSAEVFDSP